MPKAKQKQTQKSMKKQEIPAGYKTIQKTPNWNVEETPVVAGRRGETKVVTMDKGKRTERDQRTFVLQDKAIGPVMIWESSGLRELFDQTDEGDEIRIEYLGRGDPVINRDTGEKMEAPKLFSCAVKS